MSEGETNPPPAGTIAYFSMEIAVEPTMPTYAGGLGVLAGDTLRAAADEALPLVAITLVHRKGYLNQVFDQSGWQHSSPVDWPIDTFLKELPARVSVTIEGRTVSIRVWRYEVKGLARPVPVYFLDTDLPENTAWDRTLTHFLYGGDIYYRLCQEIILGIGGLRMLRALGISRVHRFHLNEGHSSLLTLELLAEEAKKQHRTTIADEDFQAVRARCVFTTHTPVASGHDQFPMDLVGRVLHEDSGFFSREGLFAPHVLDQLLQREPGKHGEADSFRKDATLNLTYLALNLSHFVNGVAKKHAEVSQRMFAKYHIDEITNGVHAATWVAPPLRRLFDAHIPGWEADNFSLRYALNLPPAELWSAHVEAKQTLLARVLADTGVSLDPKTLTLGFARRFTPYKRADLLLFDPARLSALAAKAGPLQVIFSGKAHPNDQAGKAMIQQVLRMKDIVDHGVKIVYLPNYDITLGGLMTAGVDVWLNTPLPPLEASGTSGMKAALNGVPSLSILDGWWLEGCIEGATGWAIGDRPQGLEVDDTRTARDADSLYRKLEEVVAPLYYHEPARFILIMQHAVALNGSFFTTQRMIQQYAVKAYL